MEIDLSKPTEEILNEWIKEIQAANPDLPKEKVLELAKKTLPFLNCPINNNERVLPMECMFCPYGHMTDCHHPFTCDEAECSHYQRQYGGIEL